MKIDCVFSGGGVKAYAFIGALKSVYEKNITIERVAGTSAGAILAAFVTAGIQWDEMERLINEVNLKKFLDPPILSEKIPFTKWFLLYFQLGLYKGDVFERWLYKILADKGIKTFQDIKEGYLKVIVSDISLGKLIVIPDDLERVYGLDKNSFNVATAIRMSASYPYFFMPKEIISKQKKRSYIVDGGLLSNFPLWVFRKNNKDARPVLGISLSDSLEDAQPSNIKNALDMLQALFHSMLRAHDARYISKSMQDNIVFIPVKHIKTTDFSITNEQKQSLIQLGKEKTEQFLEFWPK